MGKDAAAPLPPVRRLTEAERARVLAKLRALELAVMFTEDWTWGFQYELRRWERTARRGELLCSDVPKIEAAFERHGVGRG